MKQFHYVSSFSDDLYSVSGKTLIGSFLSTKSEGLLSVFVESDLIKEQIEKDFHKDPRVLIRRLQDAYWLADWLAANHDIIPEHLGGSYRGPCACPHPDDPKAKDHVRGCPAYWFNKNCSRWIRKFAALDLATSGSESYHIWLDADCRFLKQTLFSDVEKWFGDYDLFYLRSRKRPVAETGIFGLSNSLAAYEFLCRIITQYLDRSFRDFPRWDDSYSITWNLARFSKLRSIDLATDASGHADVVIHSPIAPFISHDKGRHGRKMGIMI